MSKTEYWTGKSFRRLTISISCSVDGCRARTDEFRQDFKDLVRVLEKRHWMCEQHPGKVVIWICPNHAELAIWRVGPELASIKNPPRWEDGKLIRRPQAHI